MVPDKNKKYPEGGSDIKLIDKYNRELNYLRVSVTDRCNFRCEYCKPKVSFKHFNRDDILSLEEIHKICHVFVELGINKIRLTGGEPLIRKGIPSLIQKLSELNGLKDIALSTNGAFLSEQVEKLKSAGLNRINISLDTLNIDKFKKITKTNQLQNVIKGIKKCISLGLHPIKINVVLIKGFNDDELFDFLDYAIRWPVEIRFIELMPSRNCYERDRSMFFSNDEAKKILDRKAELTPIGNNNGVAGMHKIKDGIGKIGFISPMSDSFCSSCNRLRLTSKGNLFFCLHSEENLDLKKIIRSKDYDDKKLKESILQSVCMKPFNFDPESVSQTLPLKMSQVGG